ncbi:MAG: DUF4173 domain-containing protein [Bacteroidota bacterium]|nr:DUF4173 domain-containing protein [Bacteroidota bacterium]
MKSKIRGTLLIAGTIIFYLIFFRNLLGLNTVLFSLFIVGSLAYLFPVRMRRTEALLASAGLLFSSVIVMWHSSSMAVFVWVSSLVLLQPMVHYPKLRSMFWASLTAFIDYITVFDHLQNTETKINPKNNRFNRLWRTTKLALIPIIVLLIFYFIFREANPVFEKLTTNFFNSINEFLEKYFKVISFMDLIFLLWGFITLTWILLDKTKDHIAGKEEKFKETIRRKRPAGKLNKVSYLSKGSLKPRLKNEYRTGLMLMVMVNALLLMVNIIDINWVWFNFEYNEGFDLSQFVHEGTYLLILSILLSMGIMLYFFRKNINFYHKKKNLQTAAGIWIIQNIVLVISVALRNMHYINNFGLAYKRIGVFFFLTLVIFGLVTLFFKIKNNKTLFYLLKLNSWALWAGFILFAIPDWDIIIAKNNIGTEIKKETDLKFLMQLDAKAYPIIDKNIETLAEPGDNFYVYRLGYTTFKYAFYNKVQNFITEYEKRRFTEFNYADKKSYDYLKSKYGKDKKYANPLLPEEVDSIAPYLKDTILQD